MEEELQIETNENVKTEVVESVEKEKEKTLESLPRIEDLVKSEKEVKIQTEIQGTTKVQQGTLAKDKVFKRKSDEKKVLMKKRLKIVTAVYVSVLALFLGFAITNVVTLAMLNKDIKTNTETIQTERVLLEDVQTENPSVGEGFQISLNEPRDYSEDKQELTFLDKLTILFRNIFG